MVLSLALSLVTGQRDSVSASYDLCSAPTFHPSTAGLESNAQALPLWSARPARTRRAQR